MRVRDFRDGLEKVSKVRMLGETGELAGAVQPNVNDLLDARALQ